MPASKPVLIASDVHLGATHPDQERAFYEWLEHAAQTASWIILNGDLFDYWFEHRWGVPRGHEALLTRLREITRSGLPVTLMGGNHDWWGGRYLREDVGLEFLQEAVVRDIAGHTTLLAHGDGLGEGDYGYRVLKAVLHSKLFNFSFGLLPVAVGEWIAVDVSHTQERWNQWGPKQEARSAALEAWATEKLATDAELDLVLLGHTHLPMLREVGEGRWYVNSGDWVHNRSYVSIEHGRTPELKRWREDPQ